MHARDESAGAFFNQCAARPPAGFQESDELIFRMEGELTRFQIVSLLHGRQEMLQVVRRFIGTFRPESLEEHEILEQFAYFLFVLVELPRDTCIGAKIIRQ
jgi:hypothetical protein